jgi:hypothetical protein
MWSARTVQRKQYAPSFSTTTRLCTGDIIMKSKIEPYERNMSDKDMQGIGICTKDSIGSLMRLKVSNEVAQ